MTRRYVGDQLQDFQLEAALRRNETCDVFVSHKKDDERLALEVARCIKYYELVPWVDALDDSIQDGPQLDAKIRDIIRGSFSLMAVISDVTHESWWVPFEIGIAFDRERVLASYTDISRYELPSFLAKHPRVSNHTQLHRWCDRLRVLKQRTGTFLAEDARPSRPWGTVWASAGTTYVDEMQSLTRDFR